MSEFTQEAKQLIATLPKDKAAELAAELRDERHANEAAGRCACGNDCNRRDRMFHESMSIFVEASAGLRAKESQ